MKTICATLLCLIAVAGCSHFKENYMAKPKIEVVGAEIEDVTNSSARVLVNLKVSNPNKAAIDVDKLSYQIFLNDGTSAETHEVSNIHIPHESSKEVQLPLKIDFKEIFEAIKNVIANKDVNYRIKGSANVGLWSIPFEKVGKLDLKKD